MSEEIFEKKPFIVPGRDSVTFSFSGEPSFKKIAHNLRSCATMLEGAADRLDACDPRRATSLVSWAGAALTSTFRMLFGDLHRDRLWSREKVDRKPDQPDVLFNTNYKTHNNAKRGGLL